MYSQANVRAGKVLRPPPPRALPSVIVDTEKVLREADGSVKLVVVRPHTDGKVFAPGCASKPDGESREEPEEHKRMDHHNQEDGFRETRELDLYWKSRPVICTVKMELKLESGL